MPFPPDTDLWGALESIRDSIAALRLVVNEVKQETTAMVNIFNYLWEKILWGLGILLALFGKDGLHVLVRYSGPFIKFIKNQKKP